MVFVDMEQISAFHRKIDKNSEKPLDKCWEIWYTIPRKR